MRYVFCFRRTVQALTVAAALAMGSAAQAVTVEYTGPDGQAATFQTDVQRFAPDVDLNIAPLPELLDALLATLAGDENAYNNPGLTVCALRVEARCETRECSPGDPDEFIDLAAGETGQDPTEVLAEYLQCIGPAAGPLPGPAAPGFVPFGLTAENPNQASGG